MKRLAFLLAMVLGLCLVFTACDSGEQTSAISKPDSGVDVDLTVLSSTMVYSEVYNMIATPENYMGKTIKAKGNFAMYHDEQADKYYFAVIIKDATACCSQGLEFDLTGEHKYPDDYPTLGTEITVTGEFCTYKEGEMEYCQLKNAKMI